jgi:hypothetical protein
MTEEDKKEYKRQWCIRNREKIKAQGKEYRDSHKEERKEYGKQYRLENIEERKKYEKEYYETHKEERKEGDKRYRDSHKEEHKKYEKEWRTKNKEKLKKSKKEYNDKHKEQRKNYLNKNKEKLKISQKKYSKNLKFKKYGIDEKQYIELYNKQEGKCAICGAHQNELKSALHIDHNHKTNKIRGLLCFKCNSLLGYANDNIIKLESAVNYLKIND